MTVMGRFRACTGRLLGRTATLMARWAEEVSVASVPKADDANDRKETVEQSTSASASPSPLEEYGQALFTYVGKGTLRWESGATRDVNFEVGQYPNGRILLACSYETADPSNVLMQWGGGQQSPDPTEFQGHTAEGLRLQNVGGIASTNYLPRMRVPGEYDAFRFDGLECKPASGAEEGQYRLGLVNFHARGTRPVVVERLPGTHHLHGLAVTLLVGAKTVSAVIVPVHEADHLRRKVMTLKTSAVLSELVVDRASCVGTDELADAVSDLCLVLSVMRGTKVQWIYREDWNERQVVKTTHHAALTKAYSPLAVLGDEYETAADCARFIEVGLGALRKSSILRADRTVVDTYLDAKLEHDFLEVRAAKVALALEKLKQVCLQSCALSVGEFEVDRTEFGAVVHAMSEALQRVAVDGGISQEAASRVTSEQKLSVLNRTSFRRVVKALLALVGLKVPSSELGLFVACRNSLVHVGRFYCDAATDEQRASVPPLQTPFEEYCFMISFLDRIFLKVFGYSGQYFDWRDFPNEMTRRTLL